MFVYCGNNPISRTDSGGNLWHVVFGATLGGLLSGVTKALECMQNGNSLEETVGQVLVSTVCGAIGGALAATGIGLAGQIAIGATLGAVESAANQMIDTGTIDACEVFVDAIIGGIGGAAGGSGASHGSKFMTYHRNEFIKNIGLDGFDGAVEKLAKHTWKWAQSNLAGKTTEGVVKAMLGNKTANVIIKGTIGVVEQLAGA